MFWAGLFGGGGCRGGDDGGVEFLHADLGEAVIGFLFFVEGGGEEVDDGGLFELFGDGACCAVRGDFVVFDALCGGDEEGVVEVLLALFLDGFFAFFKEAFHGFAMGAGGFEGEFLGGLFKPRDVGFGFGEVVCEGLLQGRVGGGGGHFGEGFDQLLFSAVEVFELFFEKVCEGFERGHGEFLCGVIGATTVVGFV